MREPDDWIAERKRQMDENCYKIARSKHKTREAAKLETARKKRRKELISIWSLVVGILSLILAILFFYFG